MASSFDGPDIDAGNIGNDDVESATNSTLEMADTAVPMRCNLSILLQLRSAMICERYRLFTGEVVSSGVDRSDEW